MSYILQFPDRKQVAFRVPGDNQIPYLPPQDPPILDISSNLPYGVNMGAHKLIQDYVRGNFSKWISVPRGLGVAVSGLTSCAAIFAASENFDWIAAGHMSGDAQFVKQWCEELLHATPGVAVKYLIFGTGPDSSARRGGSVLLEYMRFCGISPARAPAVKGCGSILVHRSPGDSASVYARRDTSLH